MHFKDVKDKGTTEAEHRRSPLILDTALTLEILREMFQAFQRIVKEQEKSSMNKISSLLQSVKTDSSQIAKQGKKMNYENRTEERLEGKGKFSE